MICRFHDEPLVEYLWCIAKYPTLPKQLKGMPKDFESSPFTGFSDHTLGIEAAQYYQFQEALKWLRNISH